MKLLSLPPTLRYTFSLLILISVSVHAQNELSVNPTVPVTPPKKSLPTELVIFIHGTIPPAQWRVSDFFNILRDKIQDSIYLLSSEKIRKNHYFRRGQVMQDEGLFPIPFYDPHSCAAMVARMHEQQFEWLNQEDPELVPQQRRCYYTFGWKGILHIYTRYEAAKVLYKQLLQELDRLKSLGVDNPKIRIITFSHGGNVALNLAAVQRDVPEFYKRPLTIDNLIMFAAPVQKATADLTRSRIFKKIYHFYSANDQVQTMDFTAPNQWFSKRTFKKERHNELPQKLTQVQVRITQRVAPKKRHFKLPETIDYLTLNHPRIKLIYDDPHHTEFWHFQWGSRVYRPKFALAPMPICAFAPTIIHALERHAPAAPHTILNFAPKYHGALITNKYNKTEQYSFPLLSEDKMNVLYSFMKNFSNEKFDINQEKQHFMNALEQAETEFKSKNPGVSKHAFSSISRLWKHAFA